MNSRRPLSKNIVHLIISLAALVCGVVAGSISASLIEDTTKSDLITLINTACSEHIFLKTAWNIFKLPIIVVLLGFTPLGTVVIPILASVKGYTFSYAIGAIIKAYGLSGIWISLSIFGIQALIFFPTLLLLSMQNLSISVIQARALLHKNYPTASVVFTKQHFLISCLCFFILIILVLLETFVTPHLISHIFSNL